MNNKPLMTITDAAAMRAQQLLKNNNGEEVLGLRISLLPKGCSGMSYNVEYATEARNYEEIIEDKGVKIFIDPAATMFLIGSVMDYKEDKLSSGFTFQNPNVKATCGCGESFSF